eukprot:CAMPEP_0195128394 /NCGR_PEP_ID=MMETSP0448-20130528/139097_1 /TAXON_ID=66468 /ORGANISM="Heterocapsa triquestra, Strain CCMP 448" /LENGTH=61 /DNA_ID=CAMNT_0040166195 /DNA_START=45 /DNA_END=227 /DNA_ORIENTATION=-
MEAQPFGATCDTASQDFQPSSTFQGARPGYAFKLGRHGQGYYLDATDDEIGRRLRKGELSS